uniref:ATP synthase subunit a n=1 Tax=Liposcelis sculptilimacula TaxID=1899352 RepID=A0A191ZS72_9NEOP|nr:ATP synthase F0 subunit 6 [Liposcelis keleri]ANJ70946.1 ATP synthase F0 subunit 6 [Liposcelis sculptilimacula]
MMLMSLFSIFDPSSTNMLMSNWVMLCLFFLIFKKNIMFFSNANITLSILKAGLMNEIKIIKNYFKFYFLISVFIIIMFMNLIGLLPFVFTASSHLSVSLSMGLVLWLSFMITGWINFNQMFSHLVPLGCPVVLMPFMVLIETISLMIRPLTLSVRLTANLTAGHMIMVLLSMGAYQNYSYFFISIFSEAVIFILEIGVAFIQPYVFFILLTLYFQEVSN